MEAPDMVLTLERLNGDTPDPGEIHREVQRLSLFRYKIKTVVSLLQLAANLASVNSDWDQLNVFIPWDHVQNAQSNCASPGILKAIKIKPQRGTGA